MRIKKITKETRGRLSGLGSLAESSLIVICIIAFNVQVIPVMSQLLQDDLPRMRFDYATPILGREYRLYATLEKKNESDPGLTEKTLRFSVIAINADCVIDDWKFCYPKTTQTKNLECFCDSVRMSKDGSKHIYRFHLFIEQISLDLDGAEALITLTDYMTASTKLQVVKYTKTPPEPVQMCKGQQKKINWKFDPEKNQDIKDQFQMNSVEWHIVSETHDPKDNIKIASLNYDTRGKIVDYINAGYSDTVTHITYNVDKGEYGLNFARPVYTDKSLHVKIGIGFNKTRYEEYVENKKLPWSTESGTSNARIRRNAHQGGNATQVSSNINVTAPMITTASTTDSPTTTITTSTTSTTTTSTTTINFSPDSTDDKRNKLEALENTIKIEPLIPPDLHIEPKATMSKTVTGSHLIECSVPKGFYGSPALNLTIKERNGIMGERVKSEQGKQTVRYMKVKVKHLSFQCLLEGAALQCVQRGTAPKSVSTVNSTSLVKEDTSSLDLDKLFHFLYGMETFIVLSIIFWIFNNNIHHIRLLVWRQKMMIKMRLEELKPHPTDNEEVSDASNKDPSTGGTASGGSDNSASGSL